MGDVGKIVRIVSTSSKSFDDAISKGVKKFCSVRKGSRGASVSAMNVRIDKGKIVEYRVVLNISAELE